MAYLNSGTRIDIEIEILTEDGSVFTLEKFQSGQEKYHNPGIIPFHPEKIPPPPNFETVLPT